ncbi:helix-turn-helix transcriptional regulator [Gluconobacter wancherniae]|uniref:helix-turn-helix transcriptional regulator n=1 Tax=Gluconobacter wancherniae TaxID=1307955 RepID=UPI001B8C5353|nr:helix-turn-helix transcriptional regulator [Gluconobacter wancherniae]MBS1093956.1 helix-turn-helix domain-containing protein [Gluconobacter wancherniae]
MSSDGGNALGDFLRERRTRLDPVVFGLKTERRRTPGLRREEVAQRSNISPTWYTWLEQGRGGAPSKDVLERLATGLMLTEVEREHLFILALGHPPETRYKEHRGITARLQHVLDAMPFTPATVRTATWDVIAWNRAATILLTDYNKLPPEQRNILRLIFCEARVRSAQEDWMAVARYVVASFRADAIRAGASREITRLVAELSAESPEFEKLWRDNDVVGQGDGIKRLHHSDLGTLELEFSHFGIEGRSDLTMTTYHPATRQQALRVQSFIEARITAEEVSL